MSELVPDDSRVAMERMRAFETAGNRAAALRHAQLHATHLRETLGFDADRGVQQLTAAMASRLEDPPCAQTVRTSAKLNRAPAHSYFVHGVSDELKNLLTHVLGLRVVKVFP